MLYGVCMASTDDASRWSLTSLVKTATNRPRVGALQTELELHALIDEFIDGGEFDDLLNVSQAHTWPLRLLEFEQRVCAEATSRLGFETEAVQMWTHELLWSRYRFEPGSAGAAFEAYVAFRLAVSVASNRSGLNQWGGEHDRITYFPSAADDSPIKSVDLLWVMGTSIALFVLSDGDRCRVAATDINTLAYIDTRLQGLLTPALEQDVLALATTFRDYWIAWRRSRDNYERNLAEWMPRDLLPGSPA